jgi:(p)ppGpp synthase/HD superfamily hydrolase
MNTNEMLTLAMHVAGVAHAGQTDKAGVPYILHPVRVAAQMDPDDVLGATVALLHDVGEDCTPKLLATFPLDVREAVDALTRRGGEDYEAFIARCALDPVARRVKVADLRDNLRGDRGAPADADRQARYERALARLLNG